MTKNVENGILIIVCIFIEKAGNYTMKRKEILKRTAVIFALSLLLVALCTTIGFAMMFDGYTVNITQKTVAVGNIEYPLEEVPVTYNKVSYLPVESVLSHDGFGFGWDTEKSMFVISDANNTYKIKGESAYVLKNNEKIKLSMPVKIREGKFFVPVDFFEKALGKRMIVQGRIKGTSSDKIVFAVDKPEAYLNGALVPLDDVVLTYRGQLFMPAKSLYQGLGFTVTENDNGLTVKRHGKELTFTDNIDKMRDGDVENVKAFKFHGVLYAAESELKKVSDVEILSDGTPKVCPLFYRDLLENTVVPDDYRLPGPMYKYGGCYVSGTMAMEILQVSHNDAKMYAGVVNAIAQKLPNVTTYSILVPNSSEFYATKAKFVNHTAKIRTAYQALDPAVVPINAVQALAEHGNEKIYFSTDHHWTQRGAYYAYRAFNDYKGVDTPALESFKTNHGKPFVGSFAGFMSGTQGAAVCRANPDLLERFMPFTEVSGMAYKDMDMTLSEGRVDPVDTRFGNYMTFIGGDHPVTKFTTSNKNGKAVMIIKESYGNAFASLVVNDYETVYVLDPRKFNGFGGYTRRFNLVEFYQKHPFDDLVIINYPVGMSSTLRQAILNTVQS